MTQNNYRKWYIPHGKGIYFMAECHESTKRTLSHAPPYAYIHHHLLHTPSFTFIYLRTLSSTFLHLHTPSYTFIQLHTPSSTIIHLQPPLHIFIHLHRPPSTLIHLHTPLSNFINLHILSYTFINPHLP